MGISSKCWADIFMVITCIYAIVVTFILFGLEIISLHIVFFRYTFSKVLLQLECIGNIFVFGFQLWSLLHSSIIRIYLTSP